MKRETEEKWKKRMLAHRADTADHQPTVKSLVNQLIDDVHLANYSRDKGVTPDYTEVGVKFEAALRDLLLAAAPEKKPPMKVEVTKDSDDLSKMIWAKKRGFNEGINEYQANITALFEQKGDRDE